MSIKKGVRERGPMEPGRGNPVTPIAKTTSRTAGFTPLTVRPSVHVHFD